MCKSLFPQYSTRTPPSGNGLMGSGGGFPAPGRAVHCVVLPPRGCTIRFECHLRRRLRGPPLEVIPGEIPLGFRKSSLLSIRAITTSSGPLRSRHRTFLRKHPLHLNTNENQNKEETESIVFMSVSQTPVYELLF